MTHIPIGRLGDDIFPGSFDMLSRKVKCLMRKAICYNYQHQKPIIHTSTSLVVVEKKEKEKEKSDYDKRAVYPDYDNYPPVKPRYPPDSDWDSTKYRDGSYDRTVAWRMYDRGERLKSEEYQTAWERLEELSGEEEHELFRLPGCHSHPEPGLLELQQYVTRTHIIGGTKMNSRKDPTPAKYMSLREDDLHVYEKLWAAYQTRLQEALQDHHESLVEHRVVDALKNEVEYDAPDQEVEQALLEETMIDGLLTSTLEIMSASQDYHYLTTAQHSTDAIMRSFWLRNGYTDKELPKIQLKEKFDDPYSKDHRHIKEDKLDKFKPDPENPVEVPEPRDDDPDLEPDLAKLMIRPYMNTFRHGVWEQPDIDSTIVTFDSIQRAAFQVRTERPLPPFILRDDPISTSAKFPQYLYNPTVVGAERVEDKNISFAGYKLNDPCEFHLLSLHVLDSSYRKLVRDYPKLKQHHFNAALGVGLMAGVTSTLSQAYNQGFNPYVDITYPLVSQIVLTDGKMVQFVMYQLNTCLLWKPDEVTPHNNILWSTEQMPLYEGNIEDAKINKEVLKMLLKFLMYAPSDDDDLDLRPFLSKDAPLELPPMFTRKLPLHPWPKWNETVYI